MTTKILRISGMHCVSCSMLIEGELEDIGVRAKAQYAKQTVEVEFDETTVSIADITKAIEKAGYRVEN